MTEQRAVVKVKGLDALLSAIPAVLGFRPTESVVVCFLFSNRLVSAMRVDLKDYLSDPAGIAHHAYQVTTTNKADGIVVAFYGIDEDPADLVAQLTALAGDREVQVLGPLYGDPDQPLHTHLHAETIAAGKVIADSRGELVARVEHDPTATLTPSQDEVVAFMATDGTRDLLLTAWITRAAERAPEMLAVCRALPDPAPGGSDQVLVNACSVAAILAYRTGDGAMANVAVDRALRIDPTHQMARLTREFIRYGCKPSDLDGLVGTLIKQ